MIRHVVPVLRRRTTALALLSLSLLVACGDNDTAGRRPLGDAGTMTAGAGAPAGADVLPPGLNAAAAARLDSGNVAFRMRQYEQALRFYRSAALDVPDHPAPWYGVLMVAQATGNRALADSATQAVAVRSGGGELLNTDNAKAHKAGDSLKGLPTGHPPAR